MNDTNIKPSRCYRATLQTRSLHYQADTKDLHWSSTVRLANGNCFTLDPRLTSDSGAHPQSLGQAEWWYSITEPVQLGASWPTQKLSRGFYELPQCLRQIRRIELV